MIEDDGRVAYLYLLVNGKVVGDVWLYNRSEASDKQLSKLDMPFPNPRKFVRDGGVLGFEPSPSDFVAEWITEEMRLEGVKLRIREKLFAIVRIGDKPGFSFLAERDGPLAKVLPE